ncbi:hypothetical protein [Streptomyces erythrochromogenes]|uniref:hypothetical protein n=1 Tax=Streptomyces erythrochromogenes TaxID=285574 RepID=UPI0036825073
MYDELDTGELDTVDPIPKGFESKSQIEPRVLASSVDLLVHFRTFNPIQKWFDFNLAPCKSSSLIAVTAFEVKNGLPVQGIAPITCMNTIARDGRVSMMVTVIWGEPIRVEFDFMIFN